MGPYGPIFFTNIFQRYMTKDKIIKTALIEDSTIVDPASGKQIRVSTTVRKKYREYFAGQNGREDLSHIRNLELNDIIANDFAQSSSNVKHMFTSKQDPTKKEFIEIRSINRGQRAVAFNMFFSVIRESTIDIITLSKNWIKPTKSPRKVVYQ